MSICAICAKDLTFAWLKLHFKFSALATIDSRSPIISHYQTATISRSAIKYFWTLDNNTQKPNIILIKSTYSSIFVFCATYFKVTESAVRDVVDHVSANKVHKSLGDSHSSDLCTLLRETWSTTSWTAELCHWKHVAVFNQYLSLR